MTLSAAVNDSKNVKVSVANYADVWYGYLI